MILKSSLHEINLSVSLFVNLSYLFFDMSLFSSELSSSMSTKSSLVTKLLESKNDVLRTHSLLMER